MNTGAILVIKANAVCMLWNMSGVRKAPVTKVGKTLIRSMLFSSENFHAACSANVLDAKYICESIKQRNLIS